MTDKQIKMFIAHQKLQQHAFNFCLVSKLCFWSDVVYVAWLEMI